MSPAKGKVYAKVTQRNYRVGGPAVIERTILVRPLRSVALRSCFSTGVPLSCEHQSLHSVQKTVNELRHTICGYC
jgi:hypothetical protein